MKKILYSILAAAALFLVGGCVKETEKATDQLAKVTFNLQLDGQSTKAFADGKSVNELYVGVYDLISNEYLSQVSVEKAPITNKTASFSASLVKGRSYTLVFFAQKSGNDMYTVDLASGKVTANYANKTANTDDYDCFYKRITLENLTESSTQNIQLIRPLAQINLLTSDADVAAARVMGYTPANAGISVSNVKNVLNMVENKLEGDDATVTFAPSQCTENSFLSGYNYLAMVYVLADRDVNALKNITLKVGLQKEGGDIENFNFTVNDAPVHRNYRTNIIGSVFTADATFNIEVTPGFEGSERVNILPTVKKPTFAPGAGAVESGTKVAISCATEEAKIYYTTDGTDPTEESTLYTEPIEITAAVTIKARAYKTDYSESPIATASYTIASSGGQGGQGGSVTYTQEQLAAAAAGGASIAMNDVISFANSSTYTGAVTELRIYKSQTLTVTAASGYTITKIQFTCTASGDAKYGPGCFTSSAETYTFEGTDGIWAGSAQEVVFTASTNQVRIVSLKVTYESGSGQGGQGGGQGGGEEPTPGTEQLPYTVAQALAVIDGLADGAKTANDVYVKGVIEAVTEISTQFGNATFTMKDKGGSSLLTAFRIKDIGGANFTSEDALKANDVVIVKGKLQKYVKDNVTTPEIAQGGQLVALNPTEAAAGINLDGNFDDWANIEAIPGRTGGSIKEWKYANDENNLYFYFKIARSDIKAAKAEDPAGSGLFPFNWRRYIYIGIDTDNNATTPSAEAPSSGDMEITGCEVLALVYPFRGNATSASGTDGAKVVNGVDTQGWIKFNGNKNGNTLSAYGVIDEEYGYLEVSMPMAGITPATGTM